MSGSFNVSTSNSYISGTVTWSESNVNNANNTSDVTATMKLSRTNTGYTSYGTDTFHVTINGSTHSNTLSYTLSYNSDTTMVTGTTTVTHDSDGTKSITISWGGGGGSQGVFTVNSGSGTANLTTIPRASTLSAGSNWTLPAQIVFSISSASSSFHHTLQVEVNDGSTYHTIETFTGVGTSYTWNVSDSDMNTMLGYLRNDTTNWNQNTRITLTTYDSSNSNVGSNQYVGTATMAQANTTSYSTSFNIGDTISGTVSYGSSFSGIESNIDLIFGSSTYHLFTNFTGTSWSYNTSSIASGLYASIPTANSGTGTIKITTTYKGGTQIRNPATGGFTTYVKSGSSNPSFSNTYTYADTNSKTTGVTNNNQYIVQGQSSVTATFKTTDVATGVNSATMCYYSAILGSTVIRKDVPYSAPTLSKAANASSTVAASTHYVEYTWVNSYGESLPSPEASLAMTTGNNLVVTLPTFPTGVTSANIYISTASGSEKLQGSTTSTTYTLSAPPTTSGAAVPTTMTFPLGTVTANTNINLSIQAVDSRGNSTTTSKTVTVVPYTMPVITATAKRENGFNNNTDITLTGTYSLISVTTNGTTSNTNGLVTVQYQYKKTTDSTYTTPTPNFGYNTSGGTYSITNSPVVVSLDNLSSWNVLITVSDKLTTNTASLIVSTGQPVLFVDTVLNSVGVGKFPTSSGTFETNGYIYAGGTDFELGNMDTSRGTSSSGHYRALVKETNNTLVINLSGDFSGGVEVQGPGLTVDNAITEQGKTLATKYAPNGYGLGGIGVRLTAGTDLNTVKSNGWYDVDNPVNGVSGLSWHNLHVYASADGGFLTQVVYGMTEQYGFAWTRTFYNNSTWTAWRRNLTDSDQDVRSHIHYYTTAATSTSATYTRINFNGKVKDNLGEWNGYQFSPINGGIYMVTTTVYIGGSGNSYLDLYKNGAYAYRLNIMYNGEAGTLSGSIPIYLYSSDYIDIRVYTANASSVSASSTDSWVSIVKIA